MRAESPDARRRTPDARMLRLGRASRLAQSRDFARVRQQGERLAQGCLIANWNRLPDGASPKLGVVTSKKIGGAVERSRARRLLRETFRQHRPKHLLASASVRQRQAQLIHGVHQYSVLVVHCTHAHGAGVVPGEKSHMSLHESLMGISAVRFIA